LLKKLKEKSKSIQFYPVANDVPSYSPAPSTGTSGNIPDWVRQMPKYTDGQTTFIYEGGSSNLTIKNCLPFLEAHTSGYVMTLPCDIQVRRLDNGTPRLTWGPTIPDPVRARPTVESYIPQMNGYDPLTFSWMPQWSVITPQGYSCQFIHPLNRIDLPFYTFGGVIDTDKWGEAGNHPFVLKQGFKGIIPKGTPIVQVIPFKRDDWKSTVTDDLGGRYMKKIRERDSVLKGWYRKNAWSNKSYR